MSDSRSEMHVQPDGARVEVGVFVHEGREFSALGSCVDESRGVICAYASGIPGAYKLTTWGGETIAPLTLVRTWKQYGCFGGFPCTIYAWSCTVNGRKYSGRNAGPQIFLRMRAGKVSS